LRAPSKASRRLRNISCIESHRRSFLGVHLLQSNKPSLEIGNFDRFDECANDRGESCSLVGKDHPARGAGNERRQCGLRIGSSTHNRKAVGWAIGTDFVCYRGEGESAADFKSRANSEARAADSSRLQILIFDTGPECEETPPHAAA
jgi:hypothetical protein